MIDSTKDTLRQRYHQTKETVSNLIEQPDANYSQSERRKNVSEPVKNMAKTGKQYAEDFADKAERKIGDAFEIVKGYKLVDKTKDNLSKARNAVSETATDVKEKIQEKAKDIKNTAVAQENRLADKSSDSEDAVKQSLRDAKHYVTEKSTDAIDSIANKTKQLTNQASSELAYSKDKVGEMTLSANKQALSRLGDAAEDLKDKAENLAETVAHRLSDFKQGLADKMSKSPTRKDMVNKASDVKDDTLSNVSEVTKKVVSKLDDSKDAIADATSKMKDRTSDVLEKAGDKLSHAYSKMKNSETFETIKEEATELKDKVMVTYETTKKSPIVISVEDKATEIKYQVADKLSDLPKTVSPTKIHNVEKKVIDMAYNFKNTVDEVKAQPTVHKLTDALYSASIMLSGAYDAVRDKVANMVFDESALKNTSQRPVDNLSGLDYNRIKSEAIDSQAQSNMNIP